MRQYLRTFLGVLAVGGTMACTDLDESLISGVSSQFYESPDGIESAVNATYSHLRRWYGREQSIVMADFGTDLFTHGGEGGRKHFNRYDPALNSTDSWLSDLWNPMYRGINTANAVLGSIDEVAGMDPQTRDLRTAEVRFLRAFFYFRLVQSWGDVPLRLEETEGVLTEMTRDRASDVYDAIVSDLEAAIATLPASQPQYGRATKGAAQHLLAKVLLTRAYKSYAQPGDFDRAAELAEAVIGSGEYALLPNYADVFDINNQGHEEVVFSVQFSYDSQLRAWGNGYHLWYLSFYDDQPGLPRSLTYGRAWRRLRPTDFAYTLWDREKETRYHDTFQHVWYATVPAMGQNDMPLEVGDTALWLPEHEVGDELRASVAYRIFAPSEWDELRWPALLKHQDPLRPAINDEDGGREFMFARLAGTHLIAAEAHLGAGRPSDAVPHINAVRRRAARPGFDEEMEIAAADVTLDFILDERGREMMGEVNRWYDLVRTGSFLDRVRAHNPQAAPLVQEHHALRPIPQSQIDAIQGGVSVFPQNVGY